jgi:DNA primase
MDVQQLLEQKKIEYVPQGQDLKVRCLNPEHDDTDPSMRIDRLTGIFNCFVCGFKGNIFSFFEEKANYLQIRRELFKRKLHEKLAENVGLELPVDRISFERNWRGISAQTYKDFEAFEHNDRNFIGRVVFPIRSVSGKILGFNARSTSPEIQPKYLIYPNGSKFPLFPPRVTPIQGKVILVEGITDMLNLYDKGLKNVVCAFGTQKVTKDKLYLLKIQGVSGIDVFFDGDDAGQTAAIKVVELIESLEMTTRNITIKSGDPGELTAEKVIRLKETLYG